MEKQISKTAVLLGRQRGLKWEIYPQDVHVFFGRAPAGRAFRCKSSPLA